MSIEAEPYICRWAESPWPPEPWLLVMVPEALQYPDYRKRAMNKEVALIDKDLGLVGHVKVSLVAEIGTAEMTIDDLFALKKGATVVLDQDCSAEVTLLLNGRPIARGDLVAVEDKLGIQLSELV